MTQRELLERRAGLVSQARAILDGAEEADRGLDAEETAQYDALMSDALDLGERAKRIRQQEALTAEMDKSVNEPVKPDPGDDTPEAHAARWLEEGRKKVGHFLRNWEGGTGTLELRALMSASDIYGGYLVTPMQFVQDMIQAVDDLTFVRQWATIQQVANAESLGAPSLDNDPADPTWTSELLTGSEDSTMSFGRRELTPHPLAQRIKVSRKLLRQVPSIEALVRDRLAYKFSVVEENAFLNGDGNGQPLGVFVASDNGISTGRDVSDGNTTTEIRFDNLINVKYTLKSQYWARARWMFHRDGVKIISKLKDGNGQYLWRESVRAGEPDMALGFPVGISEFAPNTFTTGLYVGLLGEWSNYWIADAMSMDIQRLVELYAVTNQVGFIARLEADGMPVLEEAFVRVKLG